MPPLLRLSRKTAILAAIACVSLELGAPAASWAVAPGVAGALSIVPGLGQTVSGHPLEGIAWFAAVAAGLFFHDASVQTASFDLWMYNTYDAYRDAGAKRTAKYSVFENYVAVFNPLNIVDPLGAGLLAYQGVNESLAKSNRGGTAIGPPSPLATPFSMGLIALGEEGLFRGFVFPGLTDLTTSPIVGAIGSSLVFSAFHAVYAGQSSYAFQPMVFGTRFALGMIWCWQAWRNKWDLRKEIFAHAWFDVLYEYNRFGIIGTGGQVGGESPGKPTGTALKLSFEF